MKVCHRLTRPAALLLIGSLLCGVLAGDSPSSEMRERLRQAMEASLAKQRASVGRQMSSRPAAQKPPRFLEAVESALAKQREAVERQLRVARPASTPWKPVATGISWQRAWDPACQRLVTSEIDPHILQAARRESLSPELLRGVIDQESRYWPCAVSRKGAMGLMQLMPETAADLGVRNPFDPKQNIDGGARYLNYLLRRFGGDVPLALAAYNAGPATVDNHQDIPPIPETKQYVADIVNRLRRIEDNRAF